MQILRECSIVSDMWFAECSLRRCRCAWVRLLAEAFGLQARVSELAGPLLHLRRITCLNEPLALHAPTPHCVAVAKTADGSGFSLFTVRSSRVCKKASAQATGMG